MALAFVQKASGSITIGAAGLGTAKGTFATNPAAGNLIAFASGFDLGTGGTINSVTDTPGNIYTRIGGTFLTTLSRVDMYYAKNITGGTNIVTVVGSFTAAAGLGFTAYEISGADTVNPLDQSAFGIGTSGAAGLGTTGTTSNTTSANELLFSAFNEADVVGTIGSGWANPGTIKHENPWSVFSETKIVSATGAYAGTFSTSASTVYAGGIASFVQATAATTPSIGYKTLLGAGQ